MRLPNMPPDAITLPSRPGRSPDVWRASERYCRETTRREARNFYWGFLALPRRQRIAIYALYSFAREIDDDVDLNRGGTDVDRFLWHRRRVERCVAGEADDPVMRVLTRVVSEYGVRRDELEALIAGVESDLSVQRYETWAELREYCRLVASIVGRMCVRIFGYTDEVALELADDLGIAMQLANILRDVREDAERGRVYLPQDELRQFGVSDGEVLSGAPGAAWEPLVRHQIRRAEQHFDSGLQVTTVVPRRAGACVLTMAGMYRAILAEISRDPYLPFKRRAALGKRDKLLVMARSWLAAM